MRALAKPAVVFIVVALSIVVLGWQALDQEGYSLPTWFPEPLMLLPFMAVAAVVSLAMVAALLRADWKIPFVEVALFCFACSVGASLGFVVGWLIDEGLPFSRLRSDALIAGLAAGALQAAVQYLALAVLAPQTRSRRFLFRWITSIAPPYGVIVWLLAALLEDSSTGQLTGAGVMTLVSGAAMVNVLAARGKGDELPRDLVLRAGDLKWITKAVAVSAAVVLLAAGCLELWTRTVWYQVRAIRQLALEKISHEWSAGVGWIRLAAHVGYFEPSASAAAHFTGKDAALLWGYLADEDPRHREEYRKRSLRTCSADGTSANLRLSCLSEVEEALASHHQERLAVQARGLLAAEWDRARKELELRPHDPVHWGDVALLLQTAVQAGREKDSVQLWNSAVQVPTQSEADRDGWVDLLAWIPRAVAPPAYGSIAARLSPDARWRIRNELRRLYGGLQRAGRCEEALHWLEGVPTSRWRDLFDGVSGCEPEWAAFWRRHRGDLDPDDRAWLNAHNRTAANVAGRARATATSDQRPLTLEGAISLARSRNCRAARLALVALSKDRAVGEEALADGYLFVFDSCTGRRPQP